MSSSSLIVLKDGGGGYEGNEDVFVWVRERLIYDLDDLKLGV